MDARHYKRRGLELLSLLLIGASVYLLVRHQQPEPGESSLYNLDAYQDVDPALIGYAETARIALDFKPTALALGPDKQIYVAGEKLLAVFDVAGQPVRRQEIGGMPECLALDDAGKLYLGMRDHLETLDGQGQTAIWPVIAGKPYLTSLAVASDCLYAADAGNRIVWRLDLSGKVLNQIGGKEAGQERPGFVIPSPYFDLALATDDSLWVVNPGCHALENYRANGELISSWTKKSVAIDGFSGCCNPTHIAIRADGAFVTSEKGLPRVKVLNPVGELLSVVAGPKQFDPAAAGLDLAIDRQGRILVLDPHQRAVRIFTEIRKPGK